MCIQSAITLKNFTYSNIFQHNHSKFYQQHICWLLLYIWSTSHESINHKCTGKALTTIYIASFTTCLNVRAPVWPNSISNWPHAHNWPTFHQPCIPKCLAMKSNRALTEQAQVTVAFFHPVYGATSTVDCHAWRRKEIYVRNTSGCFHSNVLYKSIRTTDKIINKTAFLILNSDN